ncbi:MAG: adenosylmethionine--8-amino-7-oxononanoate transaminase [Planctomycetes bacterium]|nr:adenosylmethionine--8-amino-7-oxononanoate transaminase [Planctomycetota bacterium]MCH9724485.1 adenosylmethionine--8-amino-7-oxononanoate transaminase [Planctomycetota bacterium]MCH9774856.1 adenosylmethionine--8-amino-7-oxononanoate transaminase [Planctomycetota bacterium]MCH9793577.1 adenosylmethionine--8-amino-7-oxononanoate transaminase [Planctomycetota bacterium]MDF1746314.1 adenosylmethionine--8-amino-7-oxononanoate transaminase [Gimesia sp.]
MHPEELRRVDNEHVWHPFTQMRAHRDENVPIIESADGYFLKDVNGNTYLDGVSSLWCNVHGHHVPEIDQAIREQLDKVAHSTLLGLASVPSIELAGELVRRAPTGLTKIFYSDSGSTAVEIALKMAFQFHAQKQDSETQPRDLFACMQDSYHGDTIGSVSVGGIPIFHQIFGKLLFESVQIPCPAAFHRPDGYTEAGYLEYCDQELERLIVENHQRLAAFIIEPLVQGAGGMLMHPRGYLKRVRELTARYGIPLIADEVAVGLGRTGTMFACESEAVIPDFLCLAKGITGGYLPLAVTMTTDDIFSAFDAEPDEYKTFFHGHTYTGNSLACAAALATLKLFDTHQTLENVTNNTEILSKRLSELKDHPHVGEVRQQGVMVGIELVEERESNSSFPAEMRMGHQVTLMARKQGVIIRPLGDVVVLMPAPGMPGDLVHQLCDIVFAAIDEAIRLQVA